MADLKDRERGMEAQQEFRNAENANVIQQAGQGLDSSRNTNPVPGERLTTAEVKAEAGRSPGQKNAETSRANGAEAESEIKAEEREALRRQGPGDTDTDLDRQGQRPSEAAMVDPVITANPD